MLSTAITAQPCIPHMGGGKFLPPVTCSTRNTASAFGPTSA